MSSQTELNQIMNSLRDVIAGPQNQYIDVWVQSGRKVIGYQCTYAPRELIYAGDLLPVRIRGAGCQDSSAADAIMSTRICSYVRNAMALVMEGAYDFLSGEVALNTCDHVRRSYDLLRHKTPIAFHGFISVPRNVRESLLEWYLEELTNLKSHLEQHFGIVISDQNLRESIEIYNQVRARLRNLNNRRAQMNSSFAGSEFLTVAVASLVMPPRDFIKLVDRLIAVLDEPAPDSSDTPTRLVLIGGALDEPQFIKVLESQGARIVGDTLCFGDRILNTIETSNGTPIIEALGRAYFQRIPCARMMGNFPERYQNLMDLIHSTQADGVIATRITFCDPWGGEVHNLIKRMNEDDIPLLVLDREYGVMARGQIKTRVQAFLEKIATRKRR